MNCPACKQPLNEIEVTTSDKQKTKIHECYNCGGHFVPPLIVNFIPEPEAINLDSITPKNNYPVTENKNCPVCNAIMIAIKDDSVPKGVEIYSCPENHGNFFPIRQLFAFKRAQKSKLEYHELWGIPIKSIFTIILPVMAIFTAVSLIPLTLNQIKQSQEGRTQAGGVVGRPLVTPIDPTQVVVSFTTPSAAISSISLNLPDSTTRHFPGPTNPQTTHVFTLDGLIPGTPYTYNIQVGNITAGPFQFTTITP